MRLVRIAVIGLVALVFHGAATAEELISTLSQPTVAITSNYGGGSVVVFGAIETGNTPALSYDLVSTVGGPRENVTTWRKDRMAGIWINAESRTYKNIPSYFGVFANRAFDAIAPQETLRAQQIGFNYALRAPEQIDTNDPYLMNLIKIRLDEGRFNEQSGAVTFFSPTAFRAEIPIPANVLTGVYLVDLKLFSDGALVARSSLTFFVLKVGVEEFVANAATNYSLLYGLATMAMALMTGWLASVAFRKD